MNERDIELAEQAGLVRGLNQPFDSAQSKFADLVRADERERIKAANAPEIERINAHLKSLEDAVKAEREACAKFFENHWREEWTYEQIAEAIRARSGEKK